MTNYEMADGSWDSAREQADDDQARLEAVGMRHGARLRASAAALARGDRARAAILCPHGWGYDLSSPAARSDVDPRAGQAGERCMHCYSVVVDAMDPSSRILHPCEDRRA